MCAIYTLDATNAGDHTLYVVVDRPSQRRRQMAEPGLQGLRRVHLDVAHPQGSLLHVGELQRPRRLSPICSRLSFQPP